MNTTTTDLAKHQSLLSLMDAWTLGSAEVTEGLKLAKQGVARLVHQFEGSHSTWIRLEDRCPWDEERQIRQLERRVWHAFIDRSQIRTVMSMKAIQELDKQLETGEGLPPLTFENLVLMLQGIQENGAQYLAEKIREVYDWLRPDPQGWVHRKYKTTQKSAAVGVGRKVILTGALDFWGRSYHVRDYTANRLRGLDQVFHMLDSKPIDRMSYLGPLVTAIQACDRVTNDNQTEYFAFRCFRNGNLHLEILSQDLLGRFNAIAGGNRIQSAEEKAAA